ncbi:response regulator transcription factor [Streptomyces tubbatahanensis]|uniref:Response regulator transcription factor n=1 Tax=Streptomyces tubbatahanensis TaxID=2923272 RepID=A0ABY3XYF6_9ACTN|nr:response regulator transcription factor [Streptomyces tubbatahanensis]UNS99093.1 response regulator transcription factor [Streptomyces tubbatahanensis]
MGVLAASPTETSVLGTHRCDIVIADDHRLFRQGVRLLLDDSEFNIVAESGNYPETLNCVRVHRPDILILDLNLREEWVIPQIPQLLAESPQTRILVLTMHNNPAYAHEALGAGAKGYVCKEATSEELASATRALRAGGIYLDATVSAGFSAPVGTQGQGRLTPRESEVLADIAAGYTNQEIARRLYVSLRTVESLRASLRRKLDLHTRAELSEYARSHHLLN